MGKLNEIQSQKTQSYGDNAFMTTITDDTVEFDSLKDKFTFKDEVEVPSLKVNGKPITPSGPQVQSDWKQEDTEAADYIKNKPIKSGEGTNSVLIGNIDQNKATGKYSMAEGNNTRAEGAFSHAEGQSTTASGVSSHAEGQSTSASRDCSHAEGWSATASGEPSHAEGYDTKASGACSHAEGYITKASGVSSHAEGYETTASGDCSHAEGEYTTAGRKNQHVFGKYNVAETGEGTSEGTYVEIVGNGTSNDNRSNVRTLDWSGNEVLTGTLTIGGTSGATIKVDNGALKVSFDGGATWLTISAS